MRQLKPCGTQAAYYRHRRHGEEPCADCRAGAAEYERERRTRSGRPSRASWQPPRCGTTAGYQWHLRNDWPPCEACREAWAEYHRLLRRGTMIHARHDRITQRETIRDVMETRGYPMSAEVIADLVIELHPEWARESILRVLRGRMVDVEPIERGGENLWRLR